MWTIDGLNDVDRIDGGRNQTWVLHVSIEVIGEYIDSLPICIEICFISKNPENLRKNKINKTFVNKIPKNSWQGNYTNIDNWLIEILRDNSEKCCINQ